MSAWDSTVVSRRWARVHGWLWDTFNLLPHCHWMSVIHGCPPSVIRPSLLLLSVLGTVCPNMSRPHPLCLLSEVDSRLSSSGVHSHDFYRHFCSVCAVKVAVFGHFNSSFLLTYLQWTLIAVGLQHAISELKLTKSQFLWSLIIRQVSEWVKWTSIILSQVL